MSSIKNQDAEIVIDIAKPGYYLYFTGAWETSGSISDTPPRFCYSGVGKIVGVTKTVQKLFWTTPGNIAVELSSGQRFLVFTPEYEKITHLTGPATLYRNVDPALLLALLKQYHYWSPEELINVSIDLRVLDANKPESTKLIVDALNAKKEAAEKYQRDLAELQAKGKQAAAQQAAQKQALKKEMDSIDLDKLFKGN